MEQPLEVTNPCYLKEAGLGYFYLVDGKNSILFMTDSAWGFNVEEEYGEAAGFGGYNKIDLTAVAGAILSALPDEDQQKAIKLASAFSSNPKLHVTLDNIDEYFS